MLPFWREKASGGLGGLGESAQREHSGASLRWIADGGCAYTVGGHAYNLPSIRVTPTA
jgi:hypothetical protein